MTAQTPGGLEDDLPGELARVQQRLSAVEAELARRRASRTRAVARVARRAWRQPERRSSLLKDVARVVVDGPAAPTRPSNGRSYPLPTVSLPDGPVSLPDLTVAVILDPFSELAFRYEWNQVTFGPDDWRVVLERERPQLLFVESAWKGNAGRWRLHMTRDHRPSSDLRELVAWCRTSGIPTVFWNKEDPPNYDRFIETAKLFDQVFTVDADRIPDYRRDLGHDRVGLLPFGAQPRIHNPVRRGAGRVYDVAFAGTYFAEKHDERRAQMQYVLDPARDLGLHIYSRMQNEDARYHFPPPLSDHVVGSLPYEEMLAAYTSYKVFLNVNSVTGSTTMCARRLFELSAAQTPVLTAPAASVEPFFGDDVEVVSTAEETRLALTALVRHRELRDRRALRAHRRVFDDHLFAHRVDTVLTSVGLPVPSRTRSVSVVVPTNRPDQLDHVLGTIGRQTHEDLQLVLVHHGFDVDADDLRARAKDAGVERLELVAADGALTLGACMNLGVDVADGDVVAKMDDDNIYGPHYLRDLVRAFDYTDAQVVGKWAHLTWLEASGATLLRFPHAEHRYTDLVQGGTLTTWTDTARRLRFEDLPRRVDTTFLEKVRRDGGQVYSTDRYNFVSVRRPDPTSHTWRITEEQMLAGKAELLFYGDPTRHAEV